MPIRFRYKKGDKVTDPEIIKTKFKRYVEKKGKRRGTLNELTSEAKVSAAITKALAIQSGTDKANYYVASDELWCPKLEVTPGTMDPKTRRRMGSYKAQGRFKLGKLFGDDLSTSMIDFRITFRDSSDEMGLPDLVIEEATMNELPKGTPLRG